MPYPTNISRVILQNYKSLRDCDVPLAQPHDVSVIIAKREFETWFLTAAQSLGGLRGLCEGLTAPRDPEAIRGAKEWLSRNMVPGKKYSPTVDQTALVAKMDLTVARSCKSFDRLCREIGRLILSY